jgi:hypothetical protein
MESAGSLMMSAMEVSRMPQPRRGRVRPMRVAAELEERFWSALEGAVPPEVQRHLTNALREFLEAMRAMIDAAIARTEPRPEPKRPKRVVVK